MFNQFGSPSLTYSQRKQIVAGYDTLVRHIIAHESAEPYYVSFMFNRLPGRQSARIQQMWKEVTRFHDILKRNVVRKPNAPGWRALIPFLLGAPDLPVWKRAKVSVRKLQVNDGLHFNAVVLLPPRIPHGEVGRLKYERVSRLRVPLHEHVEKERCQYLTERLYRIHVTPIKEGAMVDYTLKTFKNGRTSYDDILLLN